MARSFNGANPDRIVSANTPSVSNTSVVTACAWFNRTGGTGYGLILGNTSGNPAIYHRNDDNKMAYYGNSGFVDPGSGTVTNNVWNHTAIVLSAGNNLTGYLNGVSDATVGGASFSLGGAFYVGADTVGDKFTGNIADVAIWNATLSAAEIAALAKGARPGTIRPASLLLWYPITGIQSPEPDLSGSNNNGTLTGTANASGPPVMQFTPRWPLNSPFNTATSSSTGTSFQPAWVMNQRIVVDGIGI